MNLFDILVEARMREWQQRPDAEKQRRRDGHEERVSYEGEVIREIETLVNRSKNLPDDEKQHLLKQADERTTELLTMLERRGNYVTAKLVGERIARIRRDAFGKAAD